MGFIWDCWQLISQARYANPGASHSRMDILPQARASEEAILYPPLRTVLEKCIALSSSAASYRAKEGRQAQPQHVLGKVTVHGEEMAKDASVRSWNGKKPLV